MRTVLLSTSLLLAGIAAHAQVITYVSEPAALEGNYDFTLADWSLSPDMLVPGNAVTDTLAFAFDDTAADSLCCDTVTNGAELAGKIAVIYRGVCEFGYKALQAQNNGAVAVVIVTYAGQSPVAMGEGALGSTVTIPVIMITRDAGNAMRAAYDNNEKIVMFIGNQSGIYANNLACYKQDVLMPKATANPKLISQNDTEFNIQLGSWIRNYGYNLGTGASLSAEIKSNGTTVYSETSAVQDIDINDSIFFTLPDFSASSYDGYYTLTYRVSGDSLDQFQSNDSLQLGFMIDSLYALAKVDPVTKLPLSGAHYQPSGATGGFTSCIHFQDANASRLGALGLYFSIAKSGADSVTGEYVQIQAFEWQDSFTGLSDPDITMDALNPVAEGEYDFTSNQASTMVYAPFITPLVLQDNMRYLFCLNTFNNTVFAGYDDKLDYDENWTLNDQPTSPINSGTAWNEVGFGSDVTSSIGVRMIAAEDVGVADVALSNEVKPYPNPAHDIVRIPMASFTGGATLRVIDMSGAVVSTQRVSKGARSMVEVDSTDLSNGSYMFNLVFDDGSSKSFRVVISK